MKPFNKAWFLLKYYQDSSGYLTADDPEQGLRRMNMSTDRAFFGGPRNLAPVNLPGPKTLQEFVDDSNRDQEHIEMLERMRDKRILPSEPLRPFTVPSRMKVGSLQGHTPVRRP